MKCHDKGRLPRNEYIQVRREVLQRDNWRCQYCGARTHLEVHHRQFRSHSGTDDPDNLITLCRSCHQREHMGMAEESGERTFGGLDDAAEGSTPNRETYPSLLGPEVRHLILHHNANSAPLSEYRAIAADLLDCMATAVCAYSTDLIVSEITIVCGLLDGAQGTQLKLTITDSKADQDTLFVSTQSLIRWSASLRLTSASKGRDLETISWESDKRAEFLVDYPGCELLSQVAGSSVGGVSEGEACPWSSLIISCKDLDMQSRASATLQFLRMRKPETRH